MFLQQVQVQGLVDEVIGCYVAGVRQHVFGFLVQRQWCCLGVVSL